MNPPEVESPLPPFPITASRLFTGLAIFGSVLAPFRPLPGVALAAIGAGAYVVGQIFLPRARVYRKSLYRARALAAESAEKIKALESTVGDLRERLVRLENRGR